MPDQATIRRGAPRYIRGPAAGARGVVALVPEARLSPDGRTLRPLAIIEIRPDGLRRHSVGGPTSPLKGRGDRGVALPAPLAVESTGADTWIVAGAAPPQDDPHLAAVFGPTEDAGGAAQISIATARLRPGRSPQTTPLAVLRVADGVVTLHPQRRRAAGLVRAVLLAAVLLWLGRRVRHTRQS